MRTPTRMDWKDAALLVFGVVAVLASLMMGFAR
jgi:hypothetical protein